MKSLFQEGKNCWRAEKADYVSVIVDYGNYYRNLHESISKAKKNIFVLGWDIDSRIELLRGSDAKGVSNTTFFDLICAKARENPDLQIYLNRWDYAMFFMRQREPLWEHKWHSCDLPNIHVCMDDVLPFSACHHQKIVTIDDEIAYWGGMDVALGRWDFRQHHVRNQHRADPAQLPSMDEKEKFAPYHDIQAVMCGPAAHSLARWARKRWTNACPSVKPPPLAREYEHTGIPDTWPQSDPPVFENIDAAIARTMPATTGQAHTEEVYHLILDEIAHAENFIYIENQYLACADIARALNQRLKEKSKLRLLAVSCFEPSGILERIAMWGGRVRFKDILIEGVEDRVALAYPACEENGKISDVHIHSKIMIIDDKYLHIGSANLNNRSMGMDTECDISLFGGQEAARTKIVDIRNDLIREHTGHSVEYINDVAATGDVHQLLKKKPTSRQHLYEIDDEAYRDQPLWKHIYKLADPRRPLIPARWTRLPRWGTSKESSRSLYYALAGFMLILAFFALWHYSPLSSYTDIDVLSSYLEKIRNDPFALLWIIAVYVIGGVVFFPVTVLSTAIVLLFGGLRGFIFATIGALASGLVSYTIGKWIGKDHVRRIFPHADKVMDKVCDSGIVGIIVLRMLPIAPYTLVNIVLGVIHVPLITFLLGTTLGLAPGKIMLAIFGGSFIDVFQHPDSENIAMAVGGIAAWIGVVLLCNRLAQKWQARREQLA